MKVPRVVNGAMSTGTILRVQIEDGNRGVPFPEFTMPRFCREALGPVPFSRNAGEVTASLAVCL
jgi:hypothetical protein